MNPSVRSGIITLTRLRGATKSVRSGRFQEPQRLCDPEEWDTPGDAGLCQGIWELELDGWLPCPTEFGAWMAVIKWKKVKIRESVKKMSGEES